MFLRLLAFSSILNCHNIVIRDAPMPLLLRVGVLVFSVLTDTDNNRMTLIFDL